jgi:putative ABC transport system permease protein
MSSDSMCSGAPSTQRSAAFGGWSGAKGGAGDSCSCSARARSKRRRNWFFAPVRANLQDAAQRGKFTHEIVVRFPNVSVIDLRELLESIRKVFQVVTVAIDVVGSLVILTGGLILIGAVAVTKFQRVYEAAIFKTLGASSRAIAAMLMVEYGLLGTIAGAIGSFGALALGWGVSRFALDIPWRPVLHENAVSTVATSLLIMIIGVAASADVLKRKPLAALRAE